MATIQIYELDLTLVAEIDTIQDITFNRNLYRAGLFTLNLSFNSKYAGELKKNRIILLNDDEKKIGIIKEKKYTSSGSSKMLELTGFELKYILNTRPTIPPDGETHQSWQDTPSETIIKGLIQRNCLDIVGMEFNNLVIMPDLGRGTNFNYSVRFQNLGVALEKFCRLAEIGIQITPNFITKKWELDVLVPADKTEGNPNSIVFDDEYDNLASQAYTDSDINTANYAVVLGGGEGIARTIVEVGTTETDVERIVIIVDARDLTDVDQLKTRGEEVLADLKTIQSFNAEVKRFGTFVYQKDWDLGDIVTIRNNDLNVSENKIIENVVEYHDTSGFIVDAAFGEEVKTIIEVVEAKENTVID